MENGLNDEQFEPHVKDKVKTKDEIVSSTEFVPRGNVVKSSGHTDTIVKDGWKPTGKYIGLILQAGLEILCSI